MSTYQMHEIFDNEFEYVTSMHRGDTYDGNKHEFDIEAYAGKKQIVFTVRDIEATVCKFINRNEALALANMLINGAQKIM